MTEAQQQTPEPPIKVNIKVDTVEPVVERIASALDRIASALERTAASLAEPIGAPLPVEVRLEDKNW